MRLTENIVTAVSSVMGNKMRTFLTILGIIIGISSVIMITSVGNGIQTGLNREFEKLNSNMIGIYLKNWDTDVQLSDFLTVDDVELVKNHGNIEYAAPTSSASATVDLRNRSEFYCIITGTTADYRNQGGLEIVSGRFIDDADNRSRANSAVIDEWLAKNIFGYTDVVGKTFTADFSGVERELKVVGVLKSEEENAVVSTYGQGTIFMPFETINGYADYDYADYIYAGVKDTDKMDETVEELTRLLSIAHDNTDMYGIESYMSQVEIINNVLTGFTLFIGFVAAISLLVGGIGVMNIMLVTVTERTREIGIRKSLGATDGNIRVQFMIEAVILSLMGGIIGVILGYIEGVGAGMVVSSLAEMDFSARLSIPTVAATVIITAAIGIIFGVYPAGKAAKLDPIDALRYE